MIRSIPGFIRMAGLTLAVLLAASHGVEADDSYTVDYNYGPPYVTISYTGQTNQGTAAIPFAVTDNTTKSSFTAFCIDIYHDQYSGATYSAPAYTIASSPNVVSAAYPTTAYTDLVNRLNYLGTVFSALTNQVGGDSFVAGSMQLALWTAVDKSFSYLADANLTADTNSLLQLLGAPTQNGTTSGFTFTESNGSTVNVNIAAYSQTTNYSYENGQLILIHNPVNSGTIFLNQNLLTWGQGHTINIQSVPEPSTFALAGLGTLAFMGYAFRRRAKA